MSRIQCTILALLTIHSTTCYRPVKFNWNWWTSSAFIQHFHFVITVRLRVAHENFWALNLNISCVAMEKDFQEDCIYIYHNNDVINLAVFHFTNVKHASTQPSILFTLFDFRRINFKQNFSIHKWITEEHPIHFIIENIDKYSNKRLYEPACRWCFRMNV